MECCGVGHSGGVKQCGVLWSRTLRGVKQCGTLWSRALRGSELSEAVWSVVESDCSYVVVKERGMLLETLPKSPTPHHFTPPKIPTPQHPHCMDSTILPLSDMVLGKIFGE